MFMEHGTQSWGSYIRKVPELQTYTFTDREYWGHDTKATDLLLSPSPDDTTVVHGPSWGLARFNLCNFEVLSEEEGMEMENF